MSFNAVLEDAQTSVHSVMRQRQSNIKLLIFYTIIHLKLYAATQLLYFCKVIGGTYPRFGILSAIPVIPAIMLQWEIITPLGIPVDPLVYMITAISEGTGLACCLFPVIVIKNREYMTCRKPIRLGDLTR